MGLTIATSALRSRSVRRSIAGNKGLRKIDLTQSIATTGGKNLLQKVFDGVGKFVGFISNLVSKIKLSFSALAEFVFERIEELKAFNWNATDAELEASIQGYNVQMASIWGSLVGRGIGYLGTIAVGVGVGLVIPVIGGAALAGAITTAVVAEAVPDLLGELGEALKQTLALKSRQALISGYINVRRFIKQLPVHKIASLPGIGYTFAKKIKQDWGAEGAPVLSFNKGVDDKVESIKNPVTQAFVSGVLEESWDTFVSGSFIIAQSIDDFIAAQEFENSRDGLRAVKVLPDKANPDEEILFYGREKSLMGQITGTLNTHQMIHNRDIGFTEDISTNQTLAEPQKRTLRIILYSAPAPPWKRKGTTYKKSEHKIPDPKPGLTWQDVKRATGGAAGIKVGDVSATVQFANRRNLTVYGNTKVAAITNARRLAELSESSVVRVRTSENFVSKQSTKKPVTVYGAFIHVGKVIPDSKSDRQNLDGQRYREEKTRYALWPDDAPGNLSALFT